MKLFEASDITVYKKLVLVFSDFVENNPGTGMGKVYRQLLTNGLKLIPKDKEALDILSYILKDSSGSKVVQEIMNKTFCDLPITVRPMYKDSRSKLVAFWNKGGKSYTKVIDLLDLDGIGEKGAWTNEKGDKVELIDLDISEGGIK